LGRESRASASSKRFTLEVGGLDEVAVDEGEGADRRAGEEAAAALRCSDADDGDVRRGEECWPVAPMRGRGFGGSSGRHSRWRAVGVLRHDGGLVQMTGLFP